MSNTKKCSNCMKQPTCKASRTMQEYDDVSELCVWYVSLPGVIIDYDASKFSTLKNVNPFINPAMCKLKRKESFDYPIVDFRKLPTLNGITVAHVYAKFGDKTYLPNGWYGTLEPVKSYTFWSNSSHMHRALNTIEHSIHNNEMKLHDMSKFFGMQILNGEQIFVTSMHFRTDTSGLSGPDETMSVSGLSRSGQTACVSLYAYKNDIQNAEYWNNIIEFFTSKELIDGELLYEPKYQVCRDTTMHLKTAN